MPLCKASETCVQAPKPLCKAMPTKAMPLAQGLFFQNKPIALSHKRAAHAKLMCGAHGRGQLLCARPCFAVL
jgi:hypothetical protein